MAVSLGELLAYLGIDATEFDRGLANAQKAMNKAGRQMQATGQTMSKYITLPLVAAGGAAIKLASDFQTTMTSIETLVGIAGDRVNQMKGEVISLSNETARSADELGKALFVITSAGQKGSAAMEILESSAKAAAIGLGETNDIARAVTSAMTAYGEENLSAAKATDQFLAIVREGNLEARDLAPALGRVIGIAAQLGIEFSEVGASIATFTRLGVDASEAVTGLSGIMNALLRESEQGTKVLAKYGTSYAKLRAEVKEKGLAQALVNLIDLFKGNETALVKVIPEVRGLSAVLGTAGSQGETYVQIAKSIANATGLVDQGFARVVKDSGFQFKQTIEQLKNTAIELGNLLLPVFNEVLGAVKGVIHWFANLSKETKILIVTVGGLVAALGPALILLGGIVTAISAIGAPVVAVVAGIISLGLGFMYLSDNWEAMKERISSWSWWRNMLVDMIQFLLQYNPISLFVESVNNLLKYLGKKNLIPNPFEVVADVLENLKDDTVEYEHEFGSFADTVASAVNRVKKMLLDLGKSAGVGGGVGGVMQDAAQEVVEAADVINNAVESIEDQIARFTLDDVVDKLGNFADDVKVEFFKVIDIAIITGDQLKQIAAGAFTDFANVLGNLIANNQADDFFNGLLKLVVNFVKQFGELLIGAGVAALAFKNLTIAPPAAIAAGIALVAIAGAVSAHLNKGPQAQGMALGGVVPPGFPNDTFPAMLTSGEKVIPAPDPLPKDSSHMLIEVVGTARVEGSDLLIAIKRSENKYR